VEQRGYNSVAFPIIGSGSGGFKEAKAKAIMIDELSQIDSRAKIIIVEYRRKTV
jgi:O-acetyl-ADP-ribose deacetylase (regulator of RNase III)